MAFLKRKIKDEELEAVIGQLLRYGVILSSLIVCIGGVIYLFRHSHELPRYTTFLGEPEKMKKPGLMWRSAIRWESPALIQLGLCVLIATPIARIAISIIGYLLEKDYLYVCFTIAVLAVILWNF
jgi:uncharacterized membrane protein